MPGSITAGVIFSPGFVPGLALSIDYDKIELKGRDRLRLRGAGAAVLLRGADLLLPVHHPRRDERDHVDPHRAVQRGEPQDARWDFELSYGRSPSIMSAGPLLERDDITLPRSC